MDRFSENEIKEAFAKSSQGVKDFLQGTAIVGGLVKVSEQYSLTEEDISPLIKELGYLGLRLTEEQNDYSELIKNNVENIDKCSNVEKFIARMDDFFKETCKEFLRLPTHEIKYYESDDYLVTSKRFFDKSRQIELSIMNVDYHKINSLGFGGAIWSGIMMFIGALLINPGGVFAIAGLVLIALGVFLIINRHSYYIGQKGNIDVRIDSVSKKIAPDIFSAIAKAQVGIMDKNSEEFNPKIANI